MRGPLAPLAEREFRRLFWPHRLVRQRLRRPRGDGIEALLRLGLNVSSIGGAALGGLVVTVIPSVRTLERRQT